MKKNLKYLFIMVLSFGVFTSCSEEDLDPTLAQSKSIETSINSVNDLQALIIGAYERMSASAYYGRDYIILGEVFSDNAYSNANSNRFVVEGQMDLNPDSGIAESLWEQMYAVIASVNIVIAADIQSDDETEQQQIDHLKGQAYAIRALAHFNLLQFYGQQNVGTGGMSAPGVPYVTTFRDNDNLFPPRNTVQEVVSMAYSDLDMAETLLVESLNDSSKEFITSYGAYAIEARIANYFEDWQRSLESAEVVLESGVYTVATREQFLNSFATDGGPNIIFEIANTPTDNPGINGLANIYQAGSYGDVVVLPNLAAIYADDDIRGIATFEDGVMVEDGVIREYANGTLRNVGKYPSTAPYEDNIPVIRYEELVLIYAEALLELGMTEEALEWLNMIPANRGAELYEAATKDNILLERRKELAFEGFRFHDLARTGKDIPNVDPVLQQHGGSAFGSYNFALPIPSGEVDVNANVEQNQGY